jgi:RNA polymerase sigma-70 factor (ECF subfamily)
MLVTDQSLIKKVCALDAAAWSRFVGLYREVIVRNVRRISRNWGRSWDDQKVEEAVQDVIVRLYRALPQFELGRPRAAEGEEPKRAGKFRTYLYRVVMSAVADKGRERRARGEVFDEGQVDLTTLSGPEPEPDDEWDDDYYAAILKDVLAEVRDEVSPSNPNKWRSYEEHIVRGRPAGEVAAELGISKDLVYQNASRVMTRVRKRCLEVHEEDLARRRTRSASRAATAAASRGG